MPDIRLYDRDYRTLGISPTEDLSIIRKAYKAKILQHHPDKLLDSTSMSSGAFIAIQEAYATLNNVVGTNKGQRAKEKSSTSKMQTPTSSSQRQRGKSSSDQLAPDKARRDEQQKHGRRETTVKPPQDGTPRPFKDMNKTREASRARASTEPTEHAPKSTPYNDADVKYLKTWPESSGPPPQPRSHDSSSRAPAVLPSFSFGNKPSSVRQSPSDARTRSQNDHVNAWRYDVARY